MYGYDDFFTFYFINAFSKNYLNSTVTYIDKKAKEKKNIYIKYYTIHILILVHLKYTNGIWQYE